MYQTLRDPNQSISKQLSYEVINSRMANHQATWPEAIWNEDAFQKYLNPFLTAGRNYLAMLQGDKKSQRDWWLFNRFRYLDSKYQTGDSKTNAIYVRSYAKGSVTITPYSHIYPTIQWGGNASSSKYISTCRGERNKSYTFECPVDGTINDLETYIYSADRIASIEGLPSLNIGNADFSYATKLQSLILGSDTAQNTHLKTLEVGNNKLLTLLNVRNCAALNTAVNLSECTSLETILAKGSKLPSVSLPNGGHLKTLELPAVASLTIQNQKNIETFSLESQDNLTSLFLENITNLPIENLINNSSKLANVRLINVEWQATSEQTLKSTLAKLQECKDILSNEKASVSGKVYISAISDDLLEKLNDAFPELVVVVNGVSKFFIRFINYDGTLLAKYIISEEETINDPIEGGLIESTPVHENTEDSHYTFSGWSENFPLAAKNKSYTIVARFSGEYRVRFYGYAEKQEDAIEYGEETQQWVKHGEDAFDPVERRVISAPVKPDNEQYKYMFIGWNNGAGKTLNNVTEPLKLYPIFSATKRSYRVRYICDDTPDTPLQDEIVEYGSVCSYKGELSDIKRVINGEESPYYTCFGWSPDPTKPITGTTDFHAQFIFNSETGEIQDSWATIAKNCKEGNLSNYSYGARKTIEYNVITTTSSGLTVTQNHKVIAEIVGKNHDTLTSPSSDYNNGATTAGLTFMLYGLEDYNYVMNLTQKGLKENGEPQGFNGLGWQGSDLRKTLTDVIFNALGSDLQNNIKAVNKISNAGAPNNNDLVTTSDKLWVPSATELGAINIFPVGQGTVYPMFPTDSSRVKTKLWLSDGVNKPTQLKSEPYWTRSTGVTQHPWAYIDGNGYAAATMSSSSYIGLCWGFCI